MPEIAYRWSVRGIGLDRTPGCFVCGPDARRNETSNEYMNNIAAHVSLVDERGILACFPHGARMGYRHADPAWPQLKVGSCDTHLPALERLASQEYVTAPFVANLVARVRTGGQP